MLTASDLITFTFIAKHIFMGSTFTYRNDRYITVSQLTVTLQSRANIRDSYECALHPTCYIK